MNKAGFISLLFTATFFQHCNSQPPNTTNVVTRAEVRIGGPFENSDYFTKGIPSDIDAVDTSRGWNLEGDKLLLTGIIYKRDGKTPAPGVVLYYYQTNTAGRYLHKPDEPRSMPPNSQGQTHGYIRGWVKSGADGRYSIYTVRPGSYPGSEEPAHIHATIIEPDKNEYYIDDFLFNDDKFLTEARKKRLQNRCGDGILSLKPRNKMFIGERNIVLGMNIPGYPR